MGQVTFDDLMFGDRDSRIAAWRLVVEMVETMAEEQLPGSSLLNKSIQK